MLSTPDSWLVDPSGDAYSHGLSDVLNEEALIFDHPLFHYTTEAGLDGFLRTGELWASSVNYMDDPSEVQIGSKLSAEVAEKWSGQSYEYDQIVRRISTWFKDDSERERFVISFCSEPDYLLAWRAYAADSSGYCLEFPSSAFPTRDGWYMAKIEYREEEQRAEIIRILKRLERAYLSVETPFNRDFLKWRIAISAAMWLSIVAPTFKAMQYASEQEWRLVRVRLANDEQMPLTVSHRLRGGEAIPYVARAVSGPEVSTPGAARIICGARVSDETVADVRRLAHERFPDCEVVRSQIEFRRRGRGSPVKMPAAT